jgi:acylphosphatase
MYTITGDKSLMQEKVSLYAIAQGRVQGVYFRDFTLRKAQALGLTGYVKNLSDGRSVEIWAEGDKAKLEQLLEHIKIGPEAARVDKVNAKWSDYSGNYKTFEMRF